MPITERINALFNDKATRKILVRLRGFIVVLLLASILPFIDRDRLPLAFAVSLLGEFGQLWCFASLNKKKDLAANGPYALVRNPMYLARYLIVFGFVLLLGDPGLWIALPYTVIYGFYMVNRVRREEAVLKRIFGASYAAYCNRVNRFLPKLSGSPKSALLFWDFALLKQNNGYLNLVGLLAGYAVIFAASSWLAG